MKYFFPSFYLCLILCSCRQYPVIHSKPNILFILADDWSYPYVGYAGWTDVSLPHLDSLSAHGSVFHHAFCAVPSCTPSRSALLTGRYPHNLGEAINLCGRLDASIPTYVQILKKAGYAVAFDRKGWAPGDYYKMGYHENPCGVQVPFTRFLDSVPQGQPFFFWFGTHDPHRPFDGDSTLSSRQQDLAIPGFLPDHPQVRQDLAGYYAEIKRLDQDVKLLIDELTSRRLLENTIIVITSDNGMPFPHAKANLYDYGTRVPLIITGPQQGIPCGKHFYELVNLLDLTPTFLDWAQVETKPEMDGESLLPLLAGHPSSGRTAVYLERERHCLAREDLDFGAGYPMRAVRTAEYVYIRNFNPERWPGGDESIPGTPSVFGDVDGGLAKMYIMDHRHETAVAPHFQWGFGRRPEIELYAVKKDPYNLLNLADSSAYQTVKDSLAGLLNAWMIETNDPRRSGGGAEIDLFETTSRAWITRDGIILLDN